jgi:hypothetical protein
LNNLTDSLELLTFCVGRGVFYVPDGSRDYDLEDLRMGSPSRAS